MTLRRLLRQPHKRWASVFAAILFTTSVVLGSYVYSACKKASADYTKLASDIVVAQQATPQLRIALEEGSQLPSNDQVEYIGYFISLSKQHLDSIRTNIESHRYLISGVDYLNNYFQELDDRLSQLSQQLQDTQLESGSIEPLLRSAIEIGDSQAWLYNRLFDEVHATSTKQRLIMQRLSIAVSVLLVLMVSAAITLCMAVIHLYRQHNLMQQLMLTDELTGLYNRRHLIDVAFAALTQAQRNKTPLSLLLLDLDYFKRINDTYGHPTGDVVLGQISKKLRQFCRPSDTLARIGGEEFCLLMPNTSTHDALGVADRLRLEIENNKITGLDVNANPTISIGLTTCENGSLTFDQLYSLADKALYHAKAMGRNRVESVLPPLPHPLTTHNSTPTPLIRESNDL